MKSGVSLFRAQRIWQAYSARGPISFEINNEMSVADWYDVFIEVMAALPPAYVQQYLADSETKTPTVLTELRDCAQRVGDESSLQSTKEKERWQELWQELGQLILLYMAGKSYTEIAKSYLRRTLKRFTNGRSAGQQPLPAVFRFIEKVVVPLAIDAGCFLAVQECWVNDSPVNQQVPDALQALPLCIRNGCDSLDSLAWFRFGYHQRICAHALAKELPIPPFIYGDTARSEWVRRVRSMWLSGEIYVDEGTNVIMRHTRIAIENSPVDRESIE